MSVNQLAFLILVFGSLFLYYLAPKKYQWAVLLAISLLFYRLMGVRCFLYVLLTSLSLTLGTRKMQSLSDGLDAQLEKEKGLTRKEKKEKKELVKSRKRRWLVGILVVNLGLLIVLKYGNFLIANINGLLGMVGIDPLNRLGIAAPLGISYYTLQSIGYGLEVYKGKVQAEKNPLKVLLFVTYYPQMTQGPIGRYPDLAPQLFSGHRFEYQNLAKGCELILWGLFKKAVIADNMRPLVKNIFGNYDQYGGMTLLLGCVYMAVQMYADFSGYSDLVIGISRLYGIQMMENFRRPFFSLSLGEYWRRWHISLSSWFRDYVFYPASISKGALRFGRFGQRHFSPRIKKVFPVVYAMSIVWFCTGLWHDASWRYILWGVANGVILIAGVLLEPQFTWIKKKLHINEEAWWWKGFCILRTFLIVALLKVFPGAGTTGQSLDIARRILLDFNFSLSRSALLPQMRLYTVIYVCAGLLILFFVSLIQERKGSMSLWLAERPAALKWAFYLLLLFMLMYMGKYDSLAGGFEYAQF
ncbi:MAG: MBOAT family O-acyltransferase [Eubacteriales bacterium]|nr:MBOAT family O-acyltransferase [Eubacteriales bacterium]